MVRNEGVEMEQNVMKKWVQLEDIIIAYQGIKDIVAHTPLQKNYRLSEKYDCNIYLKGKIYSMFVPSN